MTSPSWDPRTPAEIVADAMFMLVRSGVIANGQRLVEACRVVRLSVEDVRLASTRLEANPGRYVTPSGSVLVRQPDDPGDPEVARANERRRKSRLALANPGIPSPFSLTTNPNSAPSPVTITPQSETEQKCERCKATKPAESFVLRSGKRAKNCGRCEGLIRRRKRYEAALGHELLSGRSFALATGDALLDGSCALGCGLPLLADETLVVVDVLLAHERCREIAGVL